MKTKSKGKKLSEERKFGSAQGFFIMAPDFDEPLDNLKE
ncbi:DUF2281 domain-containing protein [Pontibacter saemangeumensis]